MYVCILNMTKPGATKIPISIFFFPPNVYLTLRLVSSLNNPQNSEMNFYENMKSTC
jgi:hypothetical protein